MFITLIDQVGRKYDELQQSVQTLSQELEELKASKVEARKQSDMISTGGKQKLKDLVEEVSDKFSSYFADLGYSGKSHSAGEMNLTIDLMESPLR